MVVPDWRAGSCREERVEEGRESEAESEANRWAATARHLRVKERRRGRCEVTREGFGKGEIRPRRSSCAKVKAS